MNHHRALDSITDEMAEIREHTKKVTRKLEDAIEELDSLYRYDDQHERWLQLHGRAQQLLTEVRISENKRLKPLQAEYSKAWNNKWR